MRITVESQVLPGSDRNLQNEDDSFSLVDPDPDVVCSGTVAGCDPLAGFFSGELNGQQYRVNIDQFSASTYDGIMLIDGDKMQLDARRYGDLIGGRLSNATVQPGFRARLEGQCPDFADRGWAQGRVMARYG